MAPQKGQLPKSTGQSQEEEGSFFSKYGTMLLGGLVAMGGIFAGGPIGIVLGLIGAGLALFGGNLFGGGAAKNDPSYAGPAGPAQAKPKPQRTLPLQVELDGNDPKKSIMQIDGNSYEVTMEYQKGAPKGKVLVESVNYKLVGADAADKGTTLTFSKPIEVGKLVKDEATGEMMIARDEKKMLEFGEKEIAKKLRADGKSAVTDNQIRGLKRVDEDTYMFTAEDGKKSYIVELNEKGFALQDLNGKVLKEVEIDPAAFKKSEGVRARAVGAAVESIAFKASGTAMSDDKAPALASDNDARIKKMSQDPQSKEGTFRANGIEGQFTLVTTLNKDSQEEANAIIITRNGREYTHELKKPVIVGEHTLGKDDSNAYGNKVANIEKLLKTALDADDKNIAGYEKSLKSIDGVSGSGKQYLLRTESHALAITIEKDGYSVKNLGDQNSEFVPARGDIKGGEKAVLKEALQAIKEQKVSDKPAPARGDETQASLDNNMNDHRFDKDRKAIPSLKNDGIAQVIT